MRVLPMMVVRVIASPPRVCVARVTSAARHTVRAALGVTRVSVLGAAVLVVRECFARVIVPRVLLHRASPLHGVLHLSR